MLDWQLIGRAGVRYTVAYAGATAAVAALAGVELLLLGLVALALVLLLNVAGAGGSVRTISGTENASSMPIPGTATDPAENQEFHRAIDVDLKLLFYAVGLIVFGFAGMVVVGG